MNENSRGLSQEFTGLGEALADLGTRLRHASVRLLQEGLLPTESLAEEILGARAELRSIRARLGKLAKDRGLTIPEESSSDTIKSVEAILKQIQNADRLDNSKKLRRPANEVLLRRLATLKHDRLAEYAPLVAVKEKAKSVLSGDPDSISQAALEPFLSLLALVDGRAEQDVDRRRSRIESVEAEFGKALASAASTGAIVFSHRSENLCRVSTPNGLGVGLSDASFATVSHDVVNGASPWFSGFGLTPRAVLDPFLQPISKDSSAAIFDRGATEVSASATTPTTDLVVQEEAESVVEANESAIEAPRFKENRPRVDRAETAVRGPSSVGDFLVFRTEPHVGNRSRKLGNAVRRRVSPIFEQLETLRLMSCNVISGFVYLDNNTDGLFNSGDSPIANNTVQLYNASNQLVGTTTSDSTGAYTFNSDATISTAPKSETVTASHTDITNYVAPLSVPKFDTSLGTLTAVTVQFNGTVNSEIETENTSVSSGDSVTANLSGDDSLMGPGVSIDVPLSHAPISANLAAYDGTTDYGGTSGIDFGNVSVSGSGSKILTDPTDLAAFSGTGTYDAFVNANALAQVSGGGNLDTNSLAHSSVSLSVTYEYTPMNCLSPGQYTIVQPIEPPGTLNGRESSGGTVLPFNPVLPNKIPVALGDTDSTNNNFGQILPSSLAGFVYVDNNDNGIKESGEAAIPGTTITLSGTNDLGQAVSQTMPTDSLGAYKFTNLRPGTYKLNETQPALFLDGKDTIGTPGGTTSNDMFSNISLPVNFNGVNNNFGELQPGGLGGFVYVDSNKNGIKDTGETPLSGVPIVLSGTNDLGQSVSLSTTTGTDGSYSFNGLRPGTYATTEPQQPAGFDDGEETRGNIVPLPNTIGTDVIPDISVTAGNFTPNNNFGEFIPGNPAAGGTGGLGGFVYVDANDNGIKDPGETPLSGVTIVLTGTDNTGQSVNLSTTTAADGSYSFNGLVAGTYTTTEPQQPAGYLDGQETRGNVVPLPNTVGTDVIPGIIVTENNFTPNNNFGELVPTAPSDLPQTTVGSVEREGIHHQLTTYIVHFNNGLDPATAENPAFYHLARLYRDGKVGREIPFRTAHYNSADNTVTLTPVHRVNIHYTYVFTINNGLLTNTNPEQLADLNNDGVPGGQFVTTVSRANYPHPLSGPGVIHQSLKSLGGVHTRSANPGLAREHLVQIHRLGRGLGA